MSRDPTNKQEGTGDTAPKNPIVLAGGLVGAGLAAVAAVLFFTRVQPAPEPQPTPAPVPAVAAKAEEVVLPAAPSQVGAPAEVTTIVLEDPAAAGAAPSLWDGKSARGVEDGPLVLQAATTAVGGDTVLPHLSRFSARLSVSQPVPMFATMSFDAKKGVAFERQDNNQVLARNLEGRCVQWRTKVRIAIRCTPVQQAFLDALWQAGLAWSVGSLRSLQMNNAGLTTTSIGGVNVLQFNLPPGPDGKAGTLGASFAVDSGLLVRVTASTPLGEVVMRFGNYRPGPNGSNVPAEWTIYPPERRKALIPPDKEGRAIEFPEAKYPQVGVSGPVVAYVSTFRALDSASIFQVPEESLFNQVKDKVTLDAEPLPPLLVEVPVRRGAMDESEGNKLVERTWMGVLNDWFMVVDETGNKLVGVGVTSTAGMAAEFLRESLALPEVQKLGGLAFATRNADEVPEQLKKALAGVQMTGYGKVYIRLWHIEDVSAQPMLVGGAVMAIKPAAPGAKPAP